jgi:oligo-1,6-glucosidase
MRREVLDQYDCLTVGECPGIPPELARQITDAHTGALDMVFQFEHVELDSVPGQSKWALKPLDLRDLKRSLATWQQAMADAGWNSLYFCNHDQPRVVSRYGDDGEYRVQSAKMLASVLHGLRGTPYVYQGEELGMVNYPFTEIAQCRDIETLNMHAEALARGDDPQAVMASIRAKGRDNARTPMQWSAGPNAGFSTGTPWLAVHPGHVVVNAEQARADGDSVFHHMRQLIALRRTQAVLVQGRFELLWPDHPDVFAYRRVLADAELWVVCSFSRAALWLDGVDPALAGARVLLANWPLPQGLAGQLDGTRLALRPFEALMLLR